MFIAPADVQDRKLKRRLRGYSRESVEKLLHEVVASYQQVWRERDHLQARVERLEKELAPLRAAEDRLRDVLVTAERAASDVRAQAKIDADALLEQARAKKKAQENAASEVRAQAEVDALALLEQAKAKSKASQSAMKAQQTRLRNEIERLKAVEEELHEKLRSFLRSGLQLIDDPDRTQPTPVEKLPPAVHETPAATAERSPATQKTPA